MSQAQPSRMATPARQRSLKLTWDFVTRQPPAGQKPPEEGHPSTLRENHPFR